MNFSFIHISDIHLGRAFSSDCECSFDTDVRRIYENAVEFSFNNFINFALEREVDFILISGDTFDGKEQDFRSKLILKEGLKKLDNAGIKVFLICGNHDPLTSFKEATFNFDTNSNIKIIGLNTQQYGKFTITDKDFNPLAIINAYSYKESHIKENPLIFFEPSDKNNNQIFSIGLLHCDLDADKTSPYAPVKSTDLLSYNYDYWALGHIHIPSNNQTISYAGTIQGRNTKETGAHGFKYISVENNRIKNISFIPIDTVRFENIDIDISITQDITQAYEIITDRISEFIEHEPYKTFKICLLKLTLVGIVNFYSDINQDFYKTVTERLKDSFNNYVYISDIINNTEPKTDADILIQDEGISGEIYRTVNDNNIESSVSDAFNEYINIIKQCNFSDEEIKDLKQKLIKNTKEKCFNIANSIYQSDERSQND